MFCFLYDAGVWFLLQRQPDRRLCTPPTLPARQPAPHTREQLRQIYDFLELYLAEHGYAPTIREIAVACSMAQGTALRYLDRLQAYGCITRDAERARAIALCGWKRE